LRAKIINSDEVSFVRGLLSAYSPSGRERAACMYLRRHLNGWGFERVWIDPVGNVMAERGRGRPTILLCGHIDTVTGKEGVKFEGDRIYGRGAVDAKGPLAAMALAARDYDGTGKLIFCAAVGEESDSRGVGRLSALPRIADAAIFGEPTGLRAAAFAHRGSMSLRLKIASPGGHSASPWGYENAVEKGFLLVDRIRGVLCSGRDRFSTPSIAITQMRGGGSGSRIPERSSILLDVRFPPTWDVKGMFDRIREAAGEAPGGYTYTMEVLEGTEPYIAEKDSVVVRCLREAVNETLNARLMLVKKSGSGDMGLIGRGWGIPVITYGPCDPRLSHTSGEYLEVGELEAAIKIYMRTCEKVAMSITK